MERERDRRLSCINDERETRLRPAATSTEQHNDMIQIKLSSIGLWHVSILCQNRTTRTHKIETSKTI